MRFLVIGVSLRRSDGEARYFTMELPPSDEANARQFAEDILQDDMLVDVLNEDDTLKLGQSLSDRPDYVF